MKHCAGCDTTKPLIAFAKRSAAKIGIQSKCKDCNKAYRIKNETARKTYMKEYYALHKEEFIADQKERDSKRLFEISLKKSEYYLNNIEQLKVYKKEYRQNNKGKINAWVMKRTLLKKQATPKWLTKEQLAEIEEFYIIAQELAWLNYDGKTMHVDHIMPINGKDSRGLHVPWNLQILPAEVNIKKSNKVPA